MELKDMCKLEASLAGVRLKNPVIPASGCFGFGQEFSNFFDLNVLGGISVKGTTLEPRFGNETPRIAECTAGMLNSVGLQNPGIEEVLEKELPNLRKIFNGAIILNISGFSEEEYIKCCEMADASEFVDLIELNVSCPNVRHGGMSFGTSPQSVKSLMKELRPRVRKPVFAKLTPNVTDIASVAAAAEEGGADGICLINTLLGMRIDVTSRKPVLKNVVGGFSGQAVFPVALRMVFEVSRAVKIPVMGLGGIATASDVIEMMLAGASAVQVGSENLRNPFACKDIIDALPEEMRRLGIDDIKDIVGGVRI